MFHILVMYTVLLSLQLLHSNIDAIEKKFSGSVGQLTIKCKNFMIIQLDINGMEECLNIASSIEMLSNLGEK